jgi:ubiquinone/menaquinone biosynthesis C-methylase UbiE
VGGLVTGDSSAYRYLAESMGAWHSRPTFCGALREAGFSRAEGRELFPPVASLVRAVR